MFCRGLGKSADGVLVEVGFIGFGHAPNCMPKSGWPEKCEYTTTECWVTGPWILGTILSNFSALICFRRTEAQELAMDRNFWATRPRLVSFRYGLAVISAVAAMILTLLLRGFGVSGISPLFFAAVLFSTWYGGLGPGLLATFLTTIATAYFLLKGHAASSLVIRDNILRVMVFSVVAVLTSSLQDAIKRAATASRLAKEAAESASQAKSRFLAMVSHELRTPLSPVLIIADSLEQDPALPPRLLEDVRCIRRNVDLEIRLIEDLVDLTRISAGKMHLNVEIVDIHAIIEGAIQVCRQDFSDKQLDLTVQISAVEPRVPGDPVRLQPGPLESASKCDQIHAHRRQNFAQCTKLSIGFCNNRNLRHGDWN